MKFPDKIKFCPNDGKLLKSDKGPKSKISISLKPASASLIIDEVSSFTGELIEADFPPGDHKIEVIAEGYVPQVFKVTLFPEQQFKLSLDLVSLGINEPKASVRNDRTGDVVDPNLKNSLAQVDLENMVRVRGGQFRVGSERGNPDERPVRKVETPGFYIDKFEVSCQQYAKFLECIRKEGHKWCHPLEPINKDHTPFHTYAWALKFSWIGGKFPPGMENYPVVLVDWFDAYSFATWAGKRLPTEDEWEIAAGNGEGKDYPWGSTFSEEKANVGGCPVQVGIFPQGIADCGAFDMAGNVAEWTSTAYEKDPAESKNFSGHFGEPIIKGGSWDDESRGCRVSARDVHRSPFYRSTTVGFRCVVDLSKQEQHFPLQ
ncbi:MAG: SUMF1/EgtB/PvdO family nonheme iron enzyme [Candidatus Riflebacteria bacterium]|nr:SUMF1/EgtB/PvdO family nonheme iron enzyme [Candidatus Riflebacteria bacterium]